MESRDRAKRQKYIHPLATLPTWNAIALIEGMSDRRLKATLLAMESCSETNCWFAYYDVAKLFKPMILARLATPAQEGAKE